jgi:cell division protein FtsB
LVGAAIVVLSMVLELQFISAGKKAFGLTGEKQAAKAGAVIKSEAQQVEASDDLTAIQDENTFLRNQIAQLQNGLGNGKPGRPKKQIPSELLNGHSSNGNGNGKH